MKFPKQKHKKLGTQLEDRNIFEKMNFIVRLEVQRHDDEIKKLGCSEFFQFVHYISSGSDSHKAKFVKTRNALQKLIGKKRKQFYY